MPLGRFIKHKQQCHDKYAVDICVHRALNVNDASPTSSFFIKYKRGSSHNGTSLRSNLENNVVKFDHCSFSFSCTLYYNTPTKDYESKFVSLSLNEGSTTDSKGRTLGEVRINLAALAKGVDASGKTYQLTETLVKRKVDPMKLQLTLVIKLTDGGHHSSSSPEVSDSTPPSFASVEKTSLRKLSLTGEAEHYSSSAPSSGPTTPRDSSLSISLPGDESSINSGSHTPSPQSQGSPLSASPTRIPLSASPTRLASSPLPIIATTRGFPTTMHRQASDGNLLNTTDITRRLASRHQQQEQSGTSPIPENGAQTLLLRGEKHRRTISEIPSDVRGAALARSKNGNEGSSTAPSSPRAASSPSSSSSDDAILRAKLAAQEEELLQLKQELAFRQQQDDERFLIDEMVTFMQPTYSANGIPASAYVIFRSLLQWRAFHPANTRLLVHLTEAFDRLLTRHKNDADVLLYWLSTTASLLYLFCKELQVISIGGKGSPTSESSSVKVFEGQLFSFASSFFSLYCKQAFEQLNTAISALITAAGDPNAQGLSCWDSSEIIAILTKHCAALESSIPFESLREQVLRQETHYIGARFLNVLLENSDGKKKLNLCTCAHGMGIKMVLVQIDEFMHDKVPWHSVICKQNIMKARHAADVLVVNKESLAQESVRADVCPSLSMPQVVCLLDAYAPDEFDTEPVHPGVISALRGLIRQQQDPLNNNIISEKQQQQTQQQNNKRNSLLIDISSGGELETHFTAVSKCDFSAAPITPSVLARPGFAFLRVVCTDNSPWA